MALGFLKLGNLISNHKGQRAFTMDKEIIARKYIDANGRLREIYVDERARQIIFSIIPRLPIRLCHQSFRYR